ncbi:hypothetical protein HHI36_006226, partial [Cryptolaemus montrouzieri]
DSDSSAASDNVNTTTIDLKSLQYLKDEDNTLESLSRYPNVKKNSPLNIIPFYRVLPLLNDYFLLVE